ncbi:MAG: NusG domain II-containing protein [Clostridia bacterium]|nr:NusG domain II-containing protein [Clostridia bacterium]
MKLIKEIKKGDLFLVAVLIVFCVLWFLPKGGDGNLTAEIFLEGECVQTVALSDLKEDRKLTVGGCEILLQKDGVLFLHSECSDKLCEKRGKMTNAGDAMACVPQRVVVALTSEKAADFDSVVY